MIIKDIKGGKLSLTKTKLTEISGEAIKGWRWYLLLSTLKSAKNHEDMSIFPLFAWDYPGVARLYVENNRIGCRTFDKVTFDKILKAAGCYKKFRKGKR
jgi:hypothetical protein